MNRRKRNDQNIRKKLVKVQAIKYTGNNFDEISSFTNGNIFRYDEKVVIKTHAGFCFVLYQYIEKGDWIIRGIKGEFYPCKPDIFEKTYEEVKQ